MFVRKPNMQYYGDLSYIGGGDGGDTTPKGRAAALLSLATPGGPGYTYLNYTPIKYDELSELSLTEYVANSDGYYSIHMTLYPFGGVADLSSWTIEILLNGTDIIASQQAYKVAGLTTGIGAIDCSTVELLNAGDTIRARLYYDGSTSYNIPGGPNANYADFFRL